MNTLFHLQGAMRGGVVLLMFSFLSLATQPATAQVEIVVEVEGTLSMIWPDLGPGEDPDLQTLPEFLLAVDNVIAGPVEVGNFLSLQLGPDDTMEEGGPFEFNRKRVFVSGILDPDTNRVDVRDIMLLDVIPGPFSHLLGEHALGPQKWLSILCRFGDATGVTPQPVMFFTDLMTLMDGYWQELSYDNISIDSTVAGWADMAQNRAAYLDDPATHFAGHTANLGELAQDCAAAVDAAIDFSAEDFDGINFLFNQDLDCCSWGGSVTLNLDGLNKTYSSTWMATWGWGNQDVMGQEMGHGFGLPHSSGPYTATYDSQWDVMSGGGGCALPDPDFGCIGVHTIGFHKDALGWIPAAQVYMASTDPDQVVFLERLALPPNNPGNFLVARIPIGGSMTDFYTVEARQFAGFDDTGEIPAAAVVIHLVDTTLDDRNAKVVDVDAVPDTDPNDDGAQWLPGELFVDAPNSISVAVTEQTADGFEIIINPTVADLSVTKSDNPDPVAAGTQLSYTVTVDNDGPDTANNVVVEDTLPPEVDYVSDTGGCIVAANVLTCNLGNLAASSGTSFDITVDVPADLAFSGVASISNSAEVSSDQFDDDASNNSTTITTQVIAVADIGITSFTADATPGELLIGDSIEVTLTKNVVNDGPSSPVDVDVAVTAAPSAGIDVTPASAESTIAALEIGNVAEVIENFTVTCTGPGAQEVVFTNEVAPVGATDPDLSDNVAEITVSFDCVIPVKINIHPGSFPNSVNTQAKKGVVPVAVLTTDEGEFDLPFAVDATTIDPLSVHFGPADLLLNVDPPGGATEAHNRGHIEDSFDMDEVTMDGDLDMVLHFRRPESGIESGDTEACVKGQIGAEANTFFGCDSIVTRP